MYCWGANSVGQLGQNTTSEKSTEIIAVHRGPGSAWKQITAGRSHRYARVCMPCARSATTMHLLGIRGCACVRQSAHNCAASALAGSSHPLPSCGLVEGNTAKCWGANQLGQLGTATVTDSSYPLTVVGDLGCRWIR